MSLTPGTRLGPFEILALIGSGGMGEVYRATDTRLDRILALKILPERLADDPVRQQRFEREARAVASLNHPHICGLYDVGQDRGRLPGPRVPRGPHPGTVPHQGCPADIFALGAIIYEMAAGKGPFERNTQAGIIGAILHNESIDVSRHHARISICRDEAILEDLGSRNGTYLRGERITSPRQLANGDPVGLGSVVVVFRASSAEASTRSQILPPQCGSAPAGHSPER